MDKVSSCRSRELGVCVADIEIVVFVATISATTVVTVLVNANAGSAKCVTMNSENAIARI